VSRKEEGVTKTKDIDAAMGSAVAQDVMGLQIPWPSWFAICIPLIALCFVAPASAQDNSVFNRVRQLPDLGACPSSGTADSDLKKALANALVEARKQAKNLVAMTQQAKDTGLLPADKIAEISDPAQKMDQALSSSTDDCLAARAFAKLSAPGANTSGAVPATAGDGTCEHSAAPCINQPHEGNSLITGKLGLTGGAKLPEGSTAAVKVGDDQLAIDLKDSKIYKPDTGIFSVSVSTLNAYNRVQLIQKDPAGNAIPTPSIAVSESVTCDRSAGRRPCMNTPHAGEINLSGEVAVKDNKLDPNTKISVTIDGSSAGDPVTAKEDNGKFTFDKAGLDPLPENATIQADQAPAVAGSTNTTGQVRVGKVQSARNKITVDQASLDFGHQPMQTASASQHVVVTNKTGASQTFQPLTLLGPPRDFKVSGCQNALDNNDHCTFDVVFAPFPSNRLKLRENFIAVVPSSERDTFESLRAKLAASGNAAEGLEEQWRQAMRCRDHSKGKECATKDSNATIVANKNAATATNGSAGTAANGNAGATANDEKAPTARRDATDLWERYLKKREEEGRDFETLQAEFNLVKLNAVADHWQFPFTRAVVGVDLSAPSSRTLRQSYFIDFDLLAPFRFPGIKHNVDPLENRVFFWLNPRITSLPQAANFSTISSINETGSFFDTNQTIDKIAKGFDVNGGIDIALVKPRDGIPWWAEYSNTQAKLTPSLIIGGGMSTPFSTDSTQVTSAVTQAICDAFAAPVGQQFSIGTPNSSNGAQGLFCTFNDPNASTNPQKSPLIQVQNPSSNPDPNKGVRSFIEFYEQDRSRFFRRYYAGLRLKTYFFSPDVHSYCQPFESRNLDEGDCAAPYDMFPGIIDLTFGQDESVTRGRTLGVVARLDAVYPLPWFRGMHVFGSMYTRIHGSSKVNQPFSGYTIVNPTNGAANDLNTFRFAFQPLDRDYFRIGVGVDLIQVFKKTGQPDKNAPQAPTSVTKTPGA
jgi:hypothetical protein